MTLQVLVQNLKIVLALILLLVLLLVVLALVLASTSTAVPGVLRCTRTNTTGTSTVPGSSVCCTGTQQPAAAAAAPPTLRSHQLPVD
jgi:hypothetical protein